MVSQLHAYYPFEESWDYDELYNGFEHSIPETFNIATHISDRWRDDKDRVAIFSEDAGGQKSTYTFWQLNRICNRLANYLKQRGIQKGDRVGVNIGQRPETIISHIATWKVGAISIPLSPLFGPDGLQYRLEDSGASICIVDHENLGGLKQAVAETDSIENILCVGAESTSEGDYRLEPWTVIEDYSPSFETVDTAPNDGAVIFYTSGTTGKPKGAVHGHQILLGCLPYYFSVALDLDVNNSDVLWTPIGWSWAGSLPCYIICALFYGHPVLGFEGERFSAERAFNLIEDYGVSVCLMPPAAMKSMKSSEISADEFELGSMRVVSTAGEQLGENVKDWARETFYNSAIHEGYGQSEAIGTMGECTGLFPSKEGSTGKPVIGHTLEIVDTESGEVIEEPNQVGEIAFKHEGHPAYFLEYWDNPGATEETVQNGWLLSDDLGKKDEEGYVIFLGRKDDVINTSGYRIGPEEIEDYLIDHPIVEDAGVIGVPDEDGSEVPMAFVVLASGEEKSEENKAELQEHVKSGLAKYKYPRIIEFVDELPRTTTGKIRRTELQDMYESS